MVRSLFRLGPVAEWQPRPQYSGRCGDRLNRRGSTAEETQPWTGGGMADALVLGASGETRRSSSLLRSRAELTEDGADALVLGASPILDNARALRELNRWG